MHPRRSGRRVSVIRPTAVSRVPAGRYPRRAPADAISAGRGDGCIAPAQLTITWHLDAVACPSASTRRLARHMTRCQAFGYLKITTERGGPRGATYANSLASLGQVSRTKVRHCSACLPGYTHGFRRCRRSAPARASDRLRPPGIGTDQGHSQAWKVARISGKSCCHGPTPTRQSLASTTLRWPPRSHCCCR